MERSRRWNEVGSTRTARELLDIINGSWMSQAIYVASYLRIPDHLAGGRQTSDELARATRTHAPSLRRFMRALATIDLCRELDDGSYELTAMGSMLRSDVPDSLRDWALYWGGALWPVWGGLLRTVTTGESARAPATATDKFDRLDGDGEASAVFHRAMAQLTRVDADEITRAVDLSANRLIADIGGGDGGLLIALLRANPDARGLLLERQSAVDNARRLLEKAGLAHRCEFVVGDFFRSIPSGADAYVLKSVIHDWNDEQALVILCNCRRAMLADTRLVIVERIVPARLGTSPSHRAIARADLNMMVGLGGQERTEAEYAVLLCAAGLRVDAIRPAGPVFGVLEAVRA